MQTKLAAHATTTLILGTLLMGVSLQTWAQSTATGLFQNAILFSDLYPNYSARMNGISGAQTGLGGDISNVGTNPAGLGLLKKSEFSISPQLLLANSKSSFAGGNSTGNSSNFNVGQVGLVFASPKSEALPGAFRGGAFAITFSRVNQLSSYQNFDHTYGNDQPGDSIGYNHSYLRQYRDIINRNRGNSDLLYLDSLNPFDPNLSQDMYELRLAYKNYLVDTRTHYNANGQRDYNSIFPFAPPGSRRQYGHIYNRGKQTQIDFGYGANFNDRLYIGIAAGVPITDYARTVEYNEQIVNVQSSLAADQQFQGVTFRRTETYATSGVGINGRLGALYRISDHLRVGASIQTPTTMALKTDYAFAITAPYINQYGQSVIVNSNNAPALPSDTGAKFTVSGDTDPYTYRINTTKYAITSPWRFAAGITLLDSKYGFLTVDAALVPYSTSSIRSRDGYSLSADKSALRANTRLTQQLRIGAEGRYGIGRLRAGFAYLQNPYKDGDATLSYSGGIGARWSNYYLDASVNYFTRKQSYQIYTYSDPISSKIGYVVTQITFGITY